MKSHIEMNHAPAAAPGSKFGLAPLGVSSLSSLGAASLGLVFRGLSAFRRDERGLSTVEYIILMVVVVVGAVGTWNSIGGKVKAELNKSKSNIEKLKGK